MKMETRCLVRGSLFALPRKFNDWKLCLPRGGKVEELR